MASPVPYFLLSLFLDGEVFEMGLFGHLVGEVDRLEVPNCCGRDDRNRGVEISEVTKTNLR